MSWIDAEMSRLKGEIRVLTRERNEARGSLESSKFHAEELQFCLTQARIVLDHLSQTLSDQDNRRLAHGAMIASDMHLTDRTVHIRTHLAKHPLPGMRCADCPETER